MVLSNSLLRPDPVDRRLLHLLETIFTHPRQLLVSVIYIQRICSISKLDERIKMLTLEDVQVEPELLLEF